MTTLTGQLYPRIRAHKRRSVGALSYPCSASHPLAMLLEERDCGSATTQRERSMCVNRVKVGELARPFSVTALDGSLVDLATVKGHPTLVNLFRYTGCPLCSLNYWYLIQRYPVWHAQGLQVLTIFDSSPADVQTFVAKHGMPFPVIADPEQALYRLYGSQTSWWGFWWGFVRRWRNYAEARQRGLAQSAVNGTINRMPAQFLLTPELVVARAYYGQDFGDFLPAAHIEQWLARYSEAGATVSHSDTMFVS